MYFGNPNSARRLSMAELLQQREHHDRKKSIEKLGLNKDANVIPTEYRDSESPPRIARYNSH